MYKGDRFTVIPKDFLMENAVASKSAGRAKVKQFGKVQNWPTPANFFYMIRLLFNSLKSNMQLFSLFFIFQSNEMVIFFFYLSSYYM